jgi:hypothetical protein
MSQDSEKYLYFQVAFLKNSSALEALRQDALKHHMVDHPGQLIALRLTEYYELLSKGVVQPVVTMLQEAPSEVERNGTNKEKAVPMSSPANKSVGPATGQVDSYHAHTGNSLIASPDAEQNAQEAAEYWSLL